METTTDLFDDIRPLHDSEVADTIVQLLGDPYFRRAVEPFIKPLSWEQFTADMTSCKSTDDFQRFIVYPVLLKLIGRTTTGMNGYGWENVDEQNNHLFISNHRDIVLDAAFLNMLMFDKGRPTTEIAIGDNLLIYPWIEKLVRLNKSFIVKRGVTVRQMLEVSTHLSRYIHHTVRERHQPVWIAQREGRAKDSDDKTQVSLLKMLTLRDSTQPLETLKQLQIIPVTISYEFDPCDYLKAWEFQLKRDNPDHKKSQADDIKNMLTGIMGFKGNVHFRFGHCINPLLNTLPADTPRNEMLEKVAAIIDREIYRNYSFFPFNYVAYDRMTGTGRFASEYTAEDERKFDEYLRTQIQKIDIPRKDDAFLRGKMIEMYGNTVKNNLQLSETVV